jgi:hypothetical protein
LSRRRDVKLLTVYRHGQPLLASAEALAVTMWVGAIWTTGLLVAPVVFDLLDDRVLAGSLAGRLFRVSAFVGLVCGGLLVLVRVLQRGSAQQRDYVLWLAVAMLVVTVIGHFGVQPVLADLRQQASPTPVMQSALAARFALWHAVSGVLYLVQCLAGAALVILRSLPERN